MPHDLEDELLRALVAGDPALAPRLAHPLLAGLVAGLAARLVADGWLVRDGDGYVPTEQARAYLAREPELLTGIDEEPAEVTLADEPLPRDAAAR